MKQTPLRSAAFVVLLLALAAIPALSQPDVKTLADGVSLTQNINTDPKSAMIVNVLRVDPQKAGVKITSALGHETVFENDPTKGRETISSLVKRTGALAGVNADFFPWTGDPLGLMISGGQLVSEPMNRAAMGVTASGKFVMDRLSFSGTCKTAKKMTYPVKGLNRERGKAEMVLFTPIYGASTGAKDGVEFTLTLDGPVAVNKDITATVTSEPARAAGTPIPAAGAALISASGGAADWITANVHKDDKLTFRFDVKPAFGTKWDDVKEAVGGGPLLVKNGQVFIDATEEQFKPDVTLGKHPRTAVGVNAKGELLVVTVDGRQDISKGMTFPELAALMKSLGAVQAINLDGGGSTTMAIKGIVVNSPSGGSERPVADALLVYGTPQAKTAPELKFADSGPLSLTSSDNRMLSLVDPATNAAPPEDVLAGVLWGSTGGLGFVNQKGYFTPSKTGTGTIFALVGDKKVELPITVLPGTPAKIAANAEVKADGPPNLATVTVSVSDAKGNGVPGVAVTVTVTGGTADAASVTTDAAGKAVFSVTLDSTLAAAKIGISAAGMTAEIKQ